LGPLEAFWHEIVKFGVSMYSTFDFRGELAKAVRGTACKEVALPINNADAKRNVPMILEIIVTPRFF